MKHRLTTCVIVLCLAVLLLCAIILGIIRYRSAQYRLPDPQQIRTIYVYSHWGGYEAQLNEQDQKKVLSALANVMLEGRPTKSEDHKFIGTTNRMFRLECVDGTCVDFAGFVSFSPFYVLDGTLCFDADFNTAWQIQETYSPLAVEYLGWK